MRIMVGRIKVGRIKLWGAALIAATVGFGGAAVAKEAASAPAIPKSSGYLGAAAVPDTLSILPPPPAKGSLPEQWDRKVFTDTRALVGKPRWTLAAKDAVDYFTVYDCVFGVRLESASLPKTFALLRRVGSDASLVTNRPKDHYQRPRPFIGTTQAICREDQREGLTKSWSYPSGHATFGWAAGLIMAELAPDKATAILMRARAFGESRTVCGVHYVSDIEEARTNGSALVATLHGNGDFRADIEAARAELAAWRAKGGAPAPDPALCKMEAEASAHTPW